MFSAFCIMSAGEEPVIATQIFPMRERMKWVEATAGPSRTGLPFVGAGTARGPGVVGRGVEVLASGFGPPSRGGAARRTAVADFIPAIDAY
jgi:hypothetical protein